MADEALDAGRLNAGRPDGWLARLAGMSDPRGILDLEMSRRGTSPVLIGRAAEITALEAAFEAVRQGGPAALLIGGEAGVGKTRLISEFATGARAAGARVLTGGCLELGADGLPFGPFTAILRDLVREIGAEEIAGMLPGSGRAVRELARLLPELAGDQAPDARAAGDGTAATVPYAGEARARLFEEFLTLLERLAGQRPVVLVVEDAHWADRSSRDLLAFLIGYQRALRNVLIVATFRSDELHRAHPLRPLLAELARIDWVERTEVPRLSRGQAEELATAVLGRIPDRALTDDLYERAEGNPLFTEELLACEDGSAGIPDSLADLLQQTVRRLPEDTQEVLRVASAGSGSIGHALLAKITGYTVDELTTVIRPAVTCNVLVTTADGYAYRHALIREAVHEDLLPGEHSSVHTKFALAIGADPSLVAGGRADIEKAHHWYSAHNTPEALTSAWQASAQASRSVAHAERLVLLARVLELWDQVPDAAERIAADHVRVLEEAVAAAGDAGEGQRGLAFVESALAELDEDTAPVRVALLLRRRHMFRHDLGLTADMADLNRGLRLVPETASGPARTQLLLAAAHCGCGSQGPQYRIWAEEALRFAQATGDLDAEAQALAILAMIEAGSSQQAAPGSEPLRLIAKAKAIAQRAEAYHPIIKLFICESHLLCGAGEYERAAMVARQGIADAERHGLARTGGAFLAINLTEPLFYLGRWDEAADVAERALDLAPPPLTRAALWIVCGSIALARGDIATAARRAAASRAVLSGTSYEDQYHVPQATLDIDLSLATDGPAAAVALATGTLDRYDLSESSPRYVWPLLVSAASAAREAPGDAAGTLLGRVRTAAEKLGAFGPVQRAWQLSFEALDPGAGAGTGDRPTDAAATTDAAVAADAAAATDAWEAIGQPYPAAVALVRAAAAALSRPAGREAAAAWLSRAATIAERLGTRPLAQQIAVLGCRAGENGNGGAGNSGGGARGGGARGGGARGGGARGGADRLGLTGREYEVLQLVAAGQSNREIAAALFISPKTASVHVSNILAKLGTATRTEAAAKAHALRLFDVPPQRNPA
jgi:DNA-binding CsgD family transcriptional regulator/tetratricopeptide (TPR) repeat protein